MLKEKKKCEYCGEEFIPLQVSQKFCKNVHTKKCEYCEKDFEVNNLAKPARTCGRKCRSKLMLEEKAKDLKNKKKCGICNEYFVPISSSHKFCNRKHIKKCEICEKEFEVSTRSVTSRTCSQSCGSALSHSEKSREKRRINNLNKYGVEHHFQRKDVVEKIQKSLNKSKNDSRIGTKKFEEIIHSKYGVKNVSSLKEIKEKKEKTYLEKYGVKNPAEMKIKNYKEWKLFEEFVDKNNFDCLDLARYFETTVGSVRAKAYRTNTMKKIKDFYKYSEPELKIKHILTEIGLEEGIDFFPHNRKIIEPKELDFYIPKFSLAIEVSPSHTHNSNFGWDKKGEGLEENYHYEKKKECEEKGVFLITIFDWMDTELITSIIKSKCQLHDKLEEKYFSECELSLNQLKEFIPFNLKSKNNYKVTSIKYKDELVSIGIFTSNEKGSHNLKFKYFNNKYDRDILFINLFKFHTVKNPNVEEITFTTDSSFEDSVFENSNVVNYIGPRINMFNEKIKFHIKSKKRIDNNFKVLSNNKFLSIYDCGHKIWKVIL